jgi:AraC-like DNA-binding protein
VRNGIKAFFYPVSVVIFIKSNQKGAVILTLNLKDLESLYATKNIVQLLMDEKGRILKISDNTAKLLIHEKKKIIGSRLKDIVLPFSQTTDNYLTPCFIRANPECPNNLFVRVNHPDLTIGRGTFLFSYSEWFRFEKSECIFIYLALQSFNYPVVQQHLAIHRSENVPLVLLDPEFKIMMMNTSFLAMLNFPDQYELYRAPILDLLDSDDSKSNPFAFLHRNIYIKSVLAENQNPWRQALAMPLGSQNSYKSLNFFTCNEFSQTDIRKNNNLILSTSSKSTPFFGPCINFYKAVNFPDHDIRIDIRCEMPRGCDLSICFNYPAISRRNTVFDPAYEFQFRFLKTFSASLFRRSALVYSAKNTRIRPDRNFRLTIERVGAHFSLYLDGELCIAYSDRFPVFGHNSSHLTFYPWEKEFSISEFSIHTRPSKFVMEKMEEKESLLIAFKASPGQLYSFRAEPVSFQNTKALAIRFFKSPVTASKQRPDISVSLFEETRKYVQDNYFRKIDFKLLAKKCYASYTHFNRKFNEHFGKSPKAYQMELRLNEARSLIKGGKYTVEEIAYMVGINDTSNLYRLLKNTRQDVKTT